METNTNETAGVKPATDQEISTRLRNELRALGAVSPGSDHSINVHLWDTGRLQWSGSTHQASSHCEVSSYRSSAVEVIAALDRTKDCRVDRVKELRERAQAMLAEATALETAPVSDPNQHILEL